MDLLTLFYSLTEFLDRGGTVLYVIYLLAFFMWFLVIERLLYFALASRHERQRLTEIWQRNQSSEDAQCIRKSLEYAFRERLTSTLPMIQILVRVTPLLGLFGTVYGMVEIFDVIAERGTGEARAMANGISLATLPTMTGMAVGIVGLFLLRHVEATANRKLHRFTEGLIDHETLAES